MATALDDAARVPDRPPTVPRPVARRAWPQSIGERGYRDTTVADIVRHARTSKRTFYEQFASKEECLIELLRRNNEDADRQDPAAVDPEADWQQQIRQAVGRLRRPHRVAAGHHAELDPRGARAGRRGPAAASAGHGGASPTCWSISATARASGARSCRRSRGRSR